jgi:hypothetical protein
MMSDGILRLPGRTKTRLIPDGVATATSAMTAMPNQAMHNATRRNRNMGRTQGGARDRWRPVGKGKSRTLRLRFLSEMKEF